MCILPSYLLTTNNLRRRQVGGNLGLAPRLQRKKLRRRRVLEVRLDGNAVPLSVNVLLEFGKCIWLSLTLGLYWLSLTMLFRSDGSTPIIGKCFTTNTTINMQQKLELFEKFI